VRHCGSNDYQESWIKQILYLLTFKKKIAFPPKVSFLGMKAGGRSQLKLSYNAGLIKTGPKVT
jgi:hypothetical protein